jgi:uncharacterized Ntn-hydrolase superfamily protein
VPSAIVAGTEMNGIGGIGGFAKFDKGAIATQNFRLDCQT